MTRFDSSDPKFNEKWDAENRRLCQAIANAISLWTSLESSLAAVLAAVMCAKSDLAEVALFSVTSTEGRIRVVDNLLSYEFESDGIEETAFLECWRAVKAKIDRKKSVRNAIAHGEVASAARQRDDRKGIQHTLRIRPAFADKVKWREIHKAPEMALELGLSANEIEQHLIAISEINEQLEALRFVISLRASGNSAWRSRCLGLAAGLLGHK